MMRDSAWTDDGRGVAGMPSRGNAGARSESEVRGVVLAGMHAWGECVLEQVMSRPLLPIAARPLVCHILGWLSGGGVKTVSVCANSDTGVFRRCLQDGRCLGLALDYYEDAMPRGPAGCVRDAAKNGGTVFLVVEGTVVPTFDVQALLRVHCEAEAALTVVLGGGGRSNGRAAKGAEPLGIYVFSRAALSMVASRGYCDIKETLIPALHRARQRVVTWAPPIESPPRVTGAASYLALNGWAVGELCRRSESLPGYRRIDSAWVHESAEVDPTARFMGPVWVGPDCVIGPSALVVGAASIGAGSVIERNAIVSRSAMWGRCRIGGGAYVDQSVLTTDTQIEPALSVRNTVWLPQERPRRNLVEWLTARCWVRSGPAEPSVKRWAAAPVRRVRWDARPVSGDLGRPDVIV